MNWKCGRKWLWPELRYYSVIGLMKVNKTANNLLEYSDCDQRTEPRVSCTLRWHAKCLIVIFVGLYVS
jgi:hypothetical protein